MTARRAIVAVVHSLFTSRSRARNDSTRDERPGCLSVAATRENVEVATSHDEAGALPRPAPPSGRALMLSVREFALLVALARRAGTIVSREDLYDSVWGGPMRSGDR